MKDLIIHCPTQEYWDAVVSKLISEGKRWNDGDTSVCSEIWSKYKKESCVFVEGETLTHEDVTYFKEVCSAIPITPAFEFLGEDQKDEAPCPHPDKDYYTINVEDWRMVDYLLMEQQTKPIKNSKSLMSQLQTVPARLKKLLNVHLRKLYELGWIDEDLDPTDDGMTELHQFLWDKYSENEEFKKIVKERHDELKKE